MKNILKFSVVMFLSIILFGCSNDNTEIQDTNQQISKSFDIVGIKIANAAEENLISNFLSQSDFTNKTSFKTGDIFEVPEVVTYTNLTGKSIVLKYKSENNKTNYEKSLILVVNNEDEIITNYEHEKIDNGNSYTIKTYKENIEWFVAEVDKNTDEIISFNFNSNANMSFWECAEMAVGACVNDGECAFICGIIWQYCLGSIGLACAYVSL